MPTKSRYEGVKHVVDISTNISKGCEECSKQIGGPDSLAESINHYIEKHGYRLLHVGTETIDGPDSAPWHTSAAVVGK
jgi:hypothetical protein